MTSYQWTGFTDEVSPELAAQIQAARQNQLSFIELRNVDGTNIGSLDPALARVHAEKLADAGIAVSSLGSPIGKTRLDEPFAPVAAMMRRLCENARIFGTTRIRIFSFYPPEGVAADDCKDEVIDRLGRLLDIAEEQSITLLHENEKGIFGDRHERCQALFAALGDRLRGILDPANYLEVGDHPLQAMKALLPWTDYLHIKDFRRSDRRIVPAGAGDGHLPEIIRLYASRPAPRFLSIEPHLTIFAGREQLETISTDAIANSTDGAYTYKDGGAAFSAALEACRQIVANQSKEDRNP